MGILFKTEGGRKGIVSWTRKRRKGMSVYAVSMGGRFIGTFSSREYDIQKNLERFLDRKGIG